MPVINGQKFACESCVRGHRVSNCNHEDRELKFIPPKGRPVKQCEHCRTARKSKSHHAKCDCGSKKDKKVKEKADSPPVEQSSPVRASTPSSHDSSCFCHDGDSCTCGSKPETAETRQVRRTPQQVVRSRPALTTSSSETKLMIRTNGHHLPCHRNNNMAHTSGLPYTIRKKNRPQTIHGALSTNEVVTSVKSPNLQYAADDLHPDLQTPTRDILNGISAASISEENLASPLYENTWTFDPISPTRQLSESNNRASIDFGHLSTSLSLSWPDLSPTRTESAFPHLQTLGTSPNFDYPEHTFQPSDLPIVSPQAATFSQAFTLDDCYAQAPGLTSNSSARSENDPWAEASSSDNLNSYWSDTLQVRSNSNSGLDRWAVESSSELNASMAPSGTAIYAEPKSTLAMYNDIASISSFDMAAQDESWLGNMGTEPQNLSTDQSNYLWDGQNFLSS